MIKFDDESEREDFVQILNEHGSKLEDFEATELDDPIPRNTVSALSSTITVTNEKSKKSQSYASGHGTSWLADFRSDLHKGYYD